MHLDAVEEAIEEQLHKDEDEYSDFAEDPDELEIIDQLLLEAAAKQKQDQIASLLITDIEDYEEPQGIRLPKVFGFEATRQWDKQTQSAGAPVGQNIRYESGEYGICLPSALSR